MESLKYLIQKGYFIRNVNEMGHNSENPDLKDLCTTYAEAHRGFKDSNPSTLADCLVLCCAFRRGATK